MSCNLHEAREGERERGSEGERKREGGREGESEREGDRGETVIGRGFV